MATLAIRWRPEPGRYDADHSFPGAWVKMRSRVRRRRLGRLARGPGIVADEAVREPWPAVVTGVNRFEGRSSLKTWLDRILGEIALGVLHPGRPGSLSARCADAVMPGSRLLLADLGGARSGYRSRWITRRGPQFQVQ